MSVGIALVFVVIFALMGLLLAATPWLMKSKSALRLRFLNLLKTMHACVCSSTDMQR